MVVTAASSCYPHSLVFFFFIVFKKEIHSKAVSDVASLTGRIKSAAATTAAPGDELHAPSEGEMKIRRWRES